MCIAVRDYVIGSANKNLRLFSDKSYQHSPCIVSQITGMLQQMAFFHSLKLNLPFIEILKRKSDKKLPLIELIYRCLIRIIVLSEF